MIRIICVGTVKEASLRELIHEYLKRMDKKFTPTIVEIKEAKRSKNASEAQTQQAIDVESKAILEKIQSKDVVYLCDVEGKMLTSEALYHQVNEHFVYESNDLVFVIGGSDGVNEDVKKRANTRLSFSKMTFPHQLFRLMLIEQLYRVYTLSYNIAYHK